MSSVGIRIRLGREVRSLSQTTLAQRLGVSQASVAAYERDLTRVPSPLLERVAEVLSFPVGFFSRGLPPPVASETVRFREHSRLRAAERNSAQVTMQLAYEMLTQVATGLRLPALRLPDRAFNDVEEAAQVTREALGIPVDRPIEHASRALERAGVRVFQVAQQPGHGAHLQAFSGWAGEELDEPVVTLYRSDAGDRLRFSLAHELGHLILHRRMPEEGKAEAEAHAFAAAFLLPRDAFLDTLGKHVTLSLLADLKRYWRVSMQAMLMRAAQFGRVDERRKRSLYVQLSRKGWRTNEPINIPPERPRLLRQVIEIKYGNPPSVRDLVREVDLPIDFVAALLMEQDGPESHSVSAAGTVIELDAARRELR